MVLSATRFKVFDRLVRLNWIELEQTATSWSFKVLPGCDTTFFGAAFLFCFGRFDAAVVCFGAGGGLRSPGT